MNRRTMTILTRTKISTKVAGIVVTMALVAVGYVAYLTGQMRRIDARYIDLIENRAEGAVWLARANRRVLQLGYEAYKTIAYEGASRQARDAADAFKASAARYSEMFDRAEKLLQGKSTELKAIRAKVAEVERICRDVVAAALKNDDAQAHRLMEQADPLIEQVSNEALAVTRAIAAETKSETDDLASTTSTTASTSLTGAIVVGLAGLLAALLVSSRGITGPLGRLQGRMRDLAEGRLEVEVEGQDRGDEVGGMARAVQVFKDNALRAEALEAQALEAREAAERERGRSDSDRAAVAAEQARIVAELAEGLALLAEGDLTSRLRAFPDAYKKLESDFNAAIGKLQDTIVVIAGNGQGIRSGSGEIAQAADDLSRRTEQQAASLEETAAALDEITATVRKTAEGARHASEVVAAARGDAERSGQVVQDAVVAMGAIERSASEISQIIGVIDEIAFQTNLLALNAGVEAARAGEAGRGFAVVASEVRALAQRSAEAAKEIKALISTSSGQVASGVSLVGETGRALARIVVQVSEITGIVSEISASAQEQATGLAQVNTAVNQMDQMTQANAAMVEQSTAASHSLVGEAEQLADLIGRFNVGEPPAGYRAAAPAPAPAPARARPAPARPATRPAARPAPRPATHGNLALKPAPAEDGWEEF